MTDTFKQIAIDALQWEMVLAPFMTAEEGEKIDTQIELIESAL